jgi:CMP-N-acetylneuraminic acid synthetase
MLNICNHKKVKNEKYELMVVLSVTNPFFSANDIRNSISYFNKTRFDGLLSISKSTSPPYNSWKIKKKKIVPVFKNSKYKYMKSTECPSTYYSNGAIRIVNVKKFLKIKHFHKLNLTY